MTRGLQAKPDRMSEAREIDLALLIADLSGYTALTETLIVMLSVPFALVGGIWLMHLLGYNLNVAVAVGFIALLGVAAEIGVVVLIYIDHALQAAAKGRAAGEMLTSEDMHESVIQGAPMRVRPIMMTVAAIVVSSRDSQHSEHALAELELAARAGYDPNAAVSLWGKMSKLGGGPPEFLSTHPAPGRRTETLQALAAKLEPVYQAARRFRQP